MKVRSTNDGTIYEAYFEIEGLEALNHVSQKRKDVFIDYLGKKYLKLRKTVIEDLNPNLSTWNEEFREKFECDNVFESRTTFSNYLKYLKEKQDEVLTNFDGYDRMIKIRTDPESGELIGLGKGLFKGLTIKFYIKPVIAL